MVSRRIYQAGTILEPYQQRREESRYLGYPPVRDIEGIEWDSNGGMGIP